MSAEVKKLAKIRYVDLETDGKNLFLEVYVDYEDGTSQAMQKIVIAENLVKYISMFDSGSKLSDMEGKVCYCFVNQRGIIEDIEPVKFG